MQNQTVFAQNIGAQGDVLFVRIGDLPEGLEPDGTRVKVAEGEVTNHNHMINCDDGVAVLERHPVSGREQSAEGFLRGQLDSLAVAFFGPATVEHVVGTGRSDVAWTGDHFDIAFAQPGVYEVRSQKALDILEDMMTTVRD